MTLTLTKVGSDEVIKETTSAEGGEYTFEKILPGEFEVTASHPTWTFEKVNFTHTQSLMESSLESFL